MEQNYARLYDKFSLSSCFLFSIYFYCIDIELQNGLSKRILCR